MSLPYVFVSFLSAVSKIVEELINSLVDHLVKCDLFSDFQYDFRSSRSTADLLTVLSHKIAWTFSGSSATQTVALDICKLFDQSQHVTLHKLYSYEYTGWFCGLFGHFLMIDDLGWLCVKIFYKIILQGFILVVLIFFVCT